MPLPIKQFLEENITGKLLDIGLSYVFVDLMPEAQVTKAEINNSTTSNSNVSVQQRTPSTNKKATYGIGANNCKPYI